MGWNRTRIFQTDQVPLFDWFPSRDFSQIDFSESKFTHPLIELVVWARVGNIRLQGGLGYSIFSFNKKIAQDRRMTILGYVKKPFYRVSNDAAEAV